jgi:hypothetical protein
MKIHEKTGIDILDVLAEDHQWFMTEGNKLSPGMYKMKYDSMTTKCAEVVTKGDRVRVTEDNNAPFTDVLGLDIYEVIHEKSGQSIYISTSELIR